MEDIQPIIARREVTTRILQAFHLKADKNLGQNFLVEESVVNRIAKATELAPEDTVLEIGPGIGTLTQALAMTGASVVSVELDKRLIPVLQETVGVYKNVRIVQGDILKVDILKVIEETRALCDNAKSRDHNDVNESDAREIADDAALTTSGSAECSVNNNKSIAPFKVCANLPYYITTPIIMYLLEQKLPLERLVVIRRNVPPVDVPDEKIFFKVVAAAFSVRRKMLTNSLKNMGGLTGEQVKAWLGRAGIDGTRRAETLSLEEFAALARTWEKN